MVWRASPEYPAQILFVMVQTIAFAALTLLRALVLEQWCAYIYRTVVHLTAHTTHTKL